MIENYTSTGELKKTNTLMEGVWPISRQYPELDVPDNWNSLDEFVSWYMLMQKPMCVPWNSPVICTDDATAITVFKHKRFMVEMYLIHPYKAIPVHSHPGLEVITVSLGGGQIMGPESVFGTSARCGITSPMLDPGEFHGGKRTQEGGGFMILSFERWITDNSMISAAVQWTGDTAGPRHDRIINYYHPGALIRPGYADISKSINNKQ